MGVNQTHILRRKPLFILSGIVLLSFDPVPPEGRLEQDAVIGQILFHLFPILGSAITGLDIAFGAVALLTLINRVHRTVPNLQKKASVHGLLHCR